MRTQEAIDTKAQAYLTEFTTKIDSDPNFKGTNLSKVLSYIAIGVISVGAIGKSKPISGSALSTGTSLYKVAKEIKKFEQGRLATKLEDHLKTMTPDLATSSTLDLVAFQHFLYSIRVQEFIGANNEYVENIKNQTRIRVETNNHRDIIDGLASVEMQNGYQTELLNAADERQRTIVRNQEFFKSALGTTLDNTVNIGADVTEVIYKLEEMGVTVNAKLNKLLQSNAQIRKEVSAVHAYIVKKEAQEKAEADEQTRRANLKGISDSFAFLGNVGKYYHSKEFCQISTIGQASVQIKDSLSLLKAANGFDFSSLTNCANIAGAVLTVISLFGKKAEDPNMIIMKQLRALAEQVHQVRVEMHERFDRLEEIIGKNHLEVLDKFSELKQDNASIKNFLSQVLTEVKTGNEDNRDSFTTISTKLQALTNRHKTAERQKALEEILTEINKISGTHRLSDSEFKDLYNMLLTKMETTSQSNIFLVGEIGASESSVVNCFEEDASNEFAANFNIAPLMDYAGRKLADNIDAPQFNPVVFVWLSMNFMTLLKNRYTLENSDQHISAPEIADLKKIIKLADRFREYVSDLRNPTLLNKLNTEFDEAGIALQTELKEFMKKEEKKIADELNDNLLKTFPSFLGTTISSFKNQTIPMKLDFAGWYTGSKLHGWHSHKVSPKATDLSTGSNSYVVAQATAASEGWAAEVKNIGTNFTNSITNLVSAKQDKTAKFVNTQLSLNMKLPENFTSNFNQMFLFPEDAIQPLLPNIANFDPKIPEVFKYAEWLGLGKIACKYSIVGNQFIIKFTMEAGDNIYDIKKISLPFSAGKYAGNEAIWRFWCGGNYHYAETTTNTHLKKDGGAGGKDWETDDYYGNIPNFTSAQGNYKKLDRDAQGVLVGATEENNFTEASVATLTKQTLDFKTDKLKALESKFARDENSTIAKALLKFSHRFYILQSLLDITFKDNEFVKTDPAFKYFKNETTEITLDDITYPIIRNRSDLKRLFADPNILGDKDIGEILGKNLEYFDRIIKPKLTILFTDVEPEIDNNFVENIVDVLRALVEKYLQIGVVDENQLVNQMSDNAIIREENRVQKDVMAAMGAAIFNNLPAEALNAVLAAAAQSLNAQGYAVNTPASFAALLGITTQPRIGPNVQNPQIVARIDNVQR